MMIDDFFKLFSLMVFFLKIHIFVTLKNFRKKNILNNINKNFVRKKILIGIKGSSI